MERPDFFTLKNGEKVKLPFSNAEYDRRVNNLRTVIDKNNLCSLISLNPITGRKHQIRKQLAIIGHPVLGDNKYNIATKGDNLMLHAYSIKFMINKIKYNYEVKYPDYFKILPSINSWHTDLERIGKGVKVDSNFTYRSDNNTEWMTVKTLKNWIAKNQDKIGNF